MSSEARKSTHSDSDNGTEVDYVCLNLYLPGFDMPLSTREVKLGYDSDRKCSVLDRGVVREIFSDTLEKIVHIVSAQPSMFSVPKKGVSIGIQSDGEAPQLSLSVSLCPTVHFWVNTSMMVYGISGLMENEIHGIQAPLIASPFLLAVNHLFDTYMQTVNDM